MILYYNHCKRALISYNIYSSWQKKNSDDVPNGRLKLKKLACMSEWKGRSSRRLTPSPGIFCTPLVCCTNGGASSRVRRSARCASMECDPPQVGQLRYPRRHRGARSSCARKPPDWSLALMRLVSPSINVETHPSRQHNEL